MDGDPQRPDTVWPSAAVGGSLFRARKEWLHTNGAGAYSSSTIAGMHTRRYHGLLVAALDPPAGRHVFLSHVDTMIAATRDTPSTPPTSRPPSEQRWELAKHQFPGVDPERAPFYLERFDQDPLPRWTWAVPAGKLEVTLALVRGENAVVLRHVWRGAKPIRLTLRPLLATRAYHLLQREHGGMLQRTELRAAEVDLGRRPTRPAAEVRVQPRKDLPRICFRGEGTFVGSPDWWRRFEYLRERDRGLDYEEDLWTPGMFEVHLDDAPAYFMAAVDRLPHGDPRDLLAATEAALVAEDPGSNAPPLERKLTIAAEAFRADLARRPGIIAGYPWFEVWGRETLIALPGLYLVPKKLDGAMRLLREMIAYMDDGVVPNRIPGAGAVPTADAALWLFEAVRMLADALGDNHPFVTDELLLALRDAFEAAVRGTHNGIHITGDGLFAAGRAGDALTWMDARRGGKAVTPRTGCPVELSALWSKGCETLARLARAAGDTALHDQAAATAQRARAAFKQRFWCDETGYPFDVISESTTGLDAFRDASVRPNAVIALAVDPECFTREQAAAVVDRARRDLVTPAGLRTLAPGDPCYIGRCEGGVEQRDGARHQGAVVPWLLGFYARAARRIGESPEALASLIASAAGNELAVGQVPEIADGAPPHAPTGCVAQAWSVAELLRALAWDLR